MQMDGREVFMFAVKSVPQVIQEVLEKNDTAQEEIEFLHLASGERRIVEAVAKRLGEPIEKFPMNLEEYGNTSSASIPILLDELNRAGKAEQRTEDCPGRIWCRTHLGGQPFWSGKKPQISNPYKCKRIKKEPELKKRQKQK